MGPAFRYEQPRSVADAAATLAREADARVLAGGQSLIAAIRVGLSAPTHLVDLRWIPGLATIRLEGGALWIGAMATHHRVATDPIVAQHSPMLSRLAQGIADQQIRNRGTLGGSVALHDPSACWPAGVLASGASIVTQQREIHVEDFFTGLYGTVLARDEIITGLRLPGSRRGVYLKIEQRASRFALVGVAVSVDDPQKGGSPRVAITGLGYGARRWREAEAALEARLAPEAILSLRLSEDEATSDLHASAAYRVHLARVLTARAVAQLCGQPAPAVPPFALA
jgi:carbon-monoxide dehydrogenase medium subunit